MANTVNTAQVFAQEAAAILEESCPFVMAVNRSRESEFDKKVNGYDVGDEVSISIPGVTVLKNQSIAANHTITQDFSHYLMINKALSDSEIARITAEFSKYV